MTAYDAAKWYALGCAWCYLALCVTVVSERPWRWLELGASYLIVWPLLGAWKRGS